MAEELLSPEVVERLREQVMRMHPEMEGAEVTVARRRETGHGSGVAAKVGLPKAVELSPEACYTVTMRKEVEAEDGVVIPLVVRITVDEQGRMVKGRSTR